MLRGFYGSILVRLRDFCGSQLQTVGAVCLHTTNLRSSGNEDGNGHIINCKGCIPVDKLTIKYARSSGPGGQNVNKVNTKVDLRFHVSSAEWISDVVRAKILKGEKNRINTNGELVIHSSKYRSQHKNLEDAIEKLEMIVEQASFVPKETSEEKKAHVRKLVKVANEKRLRNKRFLSSKKKDRRSEF